MSYRCRLIEPGPFSHSFVARNMTLALLFILVGKGLPTYFGVFVQEQTQGGEGGGQVSQRVGDEM